MPVVKNAYERKRDTYQRLEDHARRAANEARERADAAIEAAAKFEADDPDWNEKVPALLDEAMRSFALWRAGIEQVLPAVEKARRDALAWRPRG